MPSRDLERLAAFLEQMKRSLSDDDASTLGIVCANLRALTEQVHMLEEVPLH